MGATCSISMGMYIRSYSKGSLYLALLRLVQSFSHANIRFRRFASQVHAQYSSLNCFSLRHGKS